jgi:FAD/FMN-containing dehydrogenase
MLAIKRADFTGKVIFPEDPDYDETRMVFFGGIDKHPAAIIRVANTDDVRTVIKIARDTGLELAVRSGGHSTAGHSTTDGGIVLDLRDMKAIDIDVPNKTVWAETGLTTRELSQATDAHNLAIGFGDTGSVGIGGITLNGGIGFLSRKFGLAIDNLLAAEIVTASGEKL